MHDEDFVIPAKRASASASRNPGIFPMKTAVWIPACAGMTALMVRQAY